MESVIPQPTPITQLDLSWPPLSRGISEGGAFATTADPRWSAPASYTLWTAPTGAGTSLMSRMHNNEIICGYWTNTVERDLDGFPIFLPLTVQNWPAAFLMPEHLRVWRVQFLLTITGTPTEASGIQFCGCGATVGGYVTAAGNTGAFGIVGDGAGGLNFFSKKGAGTYVVTGLTLPNALTEVFQVEFQLRAANGGSAATLGLYLNGAPVSLPAAQSSWAAGSQLPAYSDATVANANKFAMKVRAADGAGSVVAIGGLRAQCGQYLVNGSQA